MRKGVATLVKYTISTGSSMAVIDSFGAQLLSLQDVLGNEYLWQRDPQFWAKTAPVLFPAVGEQKGGKAVFSGVAYDMPRHGFARDNEFEVCAQEKDAISFLLRDNEQTRRMYPFGFELVVGFKLGGDGLETRYTVKNTGEGELPFCIGGHPAFNCPVYEGDVFSDYELRFEKPETVRCPVFEGGLMNFSKAYDLLSGRDVLPLSYDLFDGDALVFDGLISRRITLISRRSRRGVQFDFGDYSTVAFWTPPHKQAPFLCFEPWFGMAGRDDDKGEEFRDKKNCVKLAPNGEWSAAYSVTFI